eukprot:scaffold1168_cov167-Amphora_coffeaeformis.AAC.12
MTFVALSDLSGPPPTINRFCRRWLLCEREAHEYVTGASARKKIGFHQSHQPSTHTTTTILAPR